MQPGKGRGEGGWPCVGSGDVGHKVKTWRGTFTKELEEIGLFTLQGTETGVAKGGNSLLTLLPTGEREMSSHLDKVFD